MDYFFIISPIIFQITIWPISRFFLWFFGNLKVYGINNLSNLPKDKGIIFVSNHSSELDPFIPPTSLPFMSRFIPLYYATRERSFYEKNGLQKLFYGGFLFRFIGGQPVRAGLRDYSKSLAKHIGLLEKKRNLFIFPEGGITKDGKLGEAHGGVAYLAERTNSLIVPIGISGVYQLSLLDFFTRKRNIKVSFGSPISQDELKIAVLRDPLDTIGIYKKEAVYVMDKVEKMIQEHD